MSQLGKLRTFVLTMTRLVGNAGADEAQLLRDGQAAMKVLIETDDWLPDAFAQPDPEYYQQYLLYCDPNERFSVVSFVWGPGQTTPVHNHTVWGVIGMLRGSETCKNYEIAANGTPLVAPTPPALSREMLPSFLPPWVIFTKWGIVSATVRRSAFMSMVQTSAP